MRRRQRTRARLVRRQATTTSLHIGLIDAGIQSEAGTHLRIAGIPQGDCAATNQDRNVRYPDLELVKNSLHVRIDLDIQIAVRLTIAGKKFSETQRVGWNGWSRSAPHRPRSWK